MKHVNKLVLSTEIVRIMKLPWSVGKNLQSLFDNRTEAMGVAMLMVLLYHLKTTMFYPGFLGVDIFLFLSAYGLCRSYESNNIKEFYKHRTVRIVPLYLLMGFVVSLIYHFCFYKQVILWDIICNMTSLNYWGLGGFVAEWYLSFLVLLYMLFPVFFSGCRLVQEYKLGGAFVVISLIFILFLLTRGLEWYYDTAIGRIPIFLLGILCYPFTEKMQLFKIGTIAFAVAFVAAVILYYCGMVNTYVLLYMLSPICLIIVGLFLRYDLKLLKRAFFFVGKYSIEIYIANVFVVLYRKAPNSIFTDMGGIDMVFLYFISNIVIAVVLAFINERIKLHTRKV